MKRRRAEEKEKDEKLIRKPNRRHEYDLERLLMALPSDMSSNVLKNLSYTDLLSLRVANRQAKEITKDEYKLVKTCENLTHYGQSCSYTDNNDPCDEYCKRFFANPFENFERNLDFYIPWPTNEFPETRLELLNLQVLCDDKAYSITLSFHMVDETEPVMRISLDNYDNHIDVEKELNNNSEMKNLILYYFKGNPSAIEYTLFSDQVMMDSDAAKEMRKQVASRNSQGEFEVKLPYPFVIKFWKGDIDVVLGFSEEGEDEENLVLEIENTIPIPVEGNEFKLIQAEPLVCELINKITWKNVRLNE